MLVVAQGRRATQGVRPMLSRKLMAAAACMTEVASADTMAAEMAATWWAKRRSGATCARCRRPVGRRNM